MQPSHGPQQRKTVYARFDALQQGPTSHHGTIAPRLARSNHFRILRAIWEQDPFELWARLRRPAVAIVAIGSDADRDEHVRRAVDRVRTLTFGRAVSIEWMRGIHDLPLQHPEALARRVERFARYAVP